MVRTLLRGWPVLVLFAGAVAWMTVGVSAQSADQPATASGAWPTYGGDLGNTRYSPLDQIDATNFNDLEVAWRFKTDNLGSRPEFKLEGTPLVANGVLYATGGTRRSVVALDAGTGELLWVHSEREGARGQASPRRLSGRGLAYWTDGVDERVLYVTIGFRLVALDAKTGMRVPDFGSDGIIDLKEAVVYGENRAIDLVTGEMGWHAAPVVARDIVVVGGTMVDGATAKTHNNTKGLVQAFDVRTGERRWTFNTVPGPGEFGHNTWEADSWGVNGNNGVWTQISVDEELGIVYLPVESPTSDYYGGHRPGDNLFGESIVAVDLNTGVRTWHFQLVHHPIWGFDMASPPILADITVNGRAIKAIAQPGKQAFLYVLDRVTGEPVWPIEERPVPQSDVPGEQTSPTQPFPTKPPAYMRQGSSVDDLIDFTPALRVAAMEVAAKYKLGPIFTPPIVSKAEGPIAVLALGAGSGGTNWPGGAFDPETHLLYVPSQANFYSWELITPPDDLETDIRYVKGTPMYGAGQGNLRALNVQGLPLAKPPYGRISAIDLDRGEIVWQRVKGDTPDRIKNHPALRDLDIAPTGETCSGLVGLLVTKTLLISGECSYHVRNGVRGAMLRAYDKASGDEVGDVFMPAPQSGSPMTYMLDGQQYIVVAVSGGTYSGEYLAFRLPS